MRQSFSRTLCAYPWRSQILCLFPLGLLLCCLTLFIGTGDEITRYFKDLRQQQPLLTEAMTLVTNWTKFCFYLLYLVILARGLYAGERALVRFVLAFTAAQIIVSAILVQITKCAVGKPRPEPALAGHGYSPFSGTSRFHSFPSGHTAEITGAASPLAARCGRAFTTLFLGSIVALVAFSRIYLSMHHISDIVGGMVAGVLTGVLTYHLCRRE